MREEPYLRVGYVAKRCDVKVSTLHFYEEKGLIRSWRNAGNQRLYKKDVLRRIAIIKAAQRMGISLEEIKQALAALPNSRTPNSKDWEQLAQFWQAQLDTRIAQLERLKNALGGCIGCGCLSMTNCPIYNQDDHLGEQAQGPVILNRQFKEITERTKDC